MKKAKTWCLMIRADGFGGLDDFTACYLWFGHQYGYPSDRSNESNCAHCAVAWALLPIPNEDLERTKQYIAAYINVEIAPEHVRAAFQRGIAHREAMGEMLK